MPPRLRYLYLALLLVVVAPLYRELSQRSDIWWTPYAMRVPLADGKDRVEIYVRGRRLEGLIGTGRLQIAEGGALSTLAMSDVGLRFNNWDRVRARRIPLLIGYAATGGITVCMLVLVLTGRLAYREERRRP